MQLPCQPGQQGPIDVTYPAEGIDLTIFNRATMPEAASALEHAACLTVTAQSTDEYSVCLQLAFYEAGQRERGDDPTLRAVFGLLPGVTVPVPFDLSWLDGQTLFAPRTLGRLKTTIFGKRIRREDVAEIVLSATPSLPDRSLRLWPCELLDAMPHIDIAAQPLIDELGQWVPRQWPGKVTDRADCNDVLHTMAGGCASDAAGETASDVAGESASDVDAAAKGSDDAPRTRPESNQYAAFSQWDRFGGWAGKHFDATGWFHVERDVNADGTPGRFWLVDPDGNAFVSTGVDCIGAGVGTRVDPVRPWLDAHVASLLDDAIHDAEADGGQRNEDTADIYNGNHRKPIVSAADPSFTWMADRHGCGGVTAFYDYGKSNLRAAFGDDWRNAWARITRKHLIDWGINTIGNWSNHEFIRQAGLPYVLPVEELAGVGYPSTATMLFRDFPDVFAPEFAEHADRYAQGLLPWRDDPNMIGYFMRNEPNWAFVYDLNIAEEMLANPADLASKHRFVQWLSDRYDGDVAKLNAAWSANASDTSASSAASGSAASATMSAFSSFDDIIAEPRFRLASALPGSADDLRAFSQLLIDRYVRVPAEALRRVDPHHLNLGMRYAYITDKSLLAGADCFDVFSINSYQRTAFDQVEHVGRMLDMPVMVGEFHHGALDRGLTAHGIRGVTTQEQRGVAYRYYVEQAARSPYFVGAHYFQYNDQSPLGRFDGENYQIGLVDVCMQEYPEMAAAMRDCHEALYPVAAGERPAFDHIPDEVNPIHY